MAGWLHGVCVGECLFVFPLCGFSLSLFCNYEPAQMHKNPICNQPAITVLPHAQPRSIYNTATIKAPNSCLITTSTITFLTLPVVLKIRFLLDGLCHH